MCCLSLRLPVPIPMPIGTRTSCPKGRESIVFLIRSPVETSLCSLGRSAGSSVTSRLRLLCLSQKDILAIISSSSQRLHWQDTVFLCIKSNGTVEKHGGTY